MRRRGRFVESVIGNEVESERRHRIIGVADRLVEVDRSIVSRANLQIDLRTPSIEEEFAGSCHESGSDSLPLMIGMTREVVDPSTVAVVADHHRSDDLVVLCEHQESPRRVRRLPVDVAAWIIVGMKQPSSPPQRNHVFRVGFIEGTDLHSLMVLEREFLGRPRIDRYF